MSDVFRNTITALTEAVTGKKREKHKPIREREQKSMKEGYTGYKDVRVTGEIWSDDDTVLVRGGKMPMSYLKWLKDKYRKYILGDVKVVRWHDGGAGLEFEISTSKDAAAALALQISRGPMGLQLPITNDVYATRWRFHVDGQEYDPQEFVGFFGESKSNPSESNLNEHVFLYRGLDERISEYRHNMVIFVPSADRYHGISGFGADVNAATNDAYRRAGDKYGTFNYVTFAEYYSLSRREQKEIEDDWNAIRESITEQGDVKSYIVYTQAIPDTLWAAALVTQNREEANRVREQMRRCGYAGVMVVETPLLPMGLSAPQLMDPGRKFKIVDSAQPQPKGDVRYVTEDELKRLNEQPAPDIKVKNPGILGLKPDEFMKKDSAYFVGLAKKKGTGPIQKALLNLERWNKNDDPKISKRARTHINAIKKELGGK